MGEWQADKFEYRADGWPLCPVCGEDELYSLEAYRSRWPASEKPDPRDEMRCYNCRWVGSVPAMPVIASARDDGGQ